jgi:hypothetical protein
MPAWLSKTVAVMRVCRPPEHSHVGKLRDESRDRECRKPAHVGREAQQRNTHQRRDREGDQRQPGRDVPIAPPQCGVRNSGRRHEADERPAKRRIVHEPARDALRLEQLIQEYRHSRASTSP